MVREPDLWAVSRRDIDGVVGTGAPHARDPITRENFPKLYRLLGEDKPRIVIATWGTLAGTRINGVDANNVLDYYANRRGAPIVATDVFTWDRGGALLTLEQLDSLRGTKLIEQTGGVFVNARNWTPDEESVRAIFNHPLCKGVFLEASPEVLTRPIFRLNNRLQIARYVVTELNKPLYLLNPPGPPAAQRTTHLESIREMMASLQSVLGDALCSDRVTIVPSAYTQTRTNVVLLPERNRGGLGGLADTYTGGLVLFGRFKRRLCRNGRLV